jgi:hypothetical protein
MKKRKHIYGVIYLVIAVILFGFAIRNIVVFWSDCPCEEINEGL